MRPALPEWSQVMHVACWLDTTALTDGMVSHDTSTDALPLPVVATGRGRWPGVDALGLMHSTTAPRDGEAMTSCVGAWS